MGIFNKKTNVLYPSCYLVYCENDEFEIVHFKEILMSGKFGYNNFTDEDQNRKNAILFNLKNWGLIDVDDDMIQPHDAFIYVLRFENKMNVTIRHKVWQS